MADEPSSDPGDEPDEEPEVSGDAPEEEPESDEGVSEETGDEKPAYDPPEEAPASERSGEESTYDPGDERDVEATDEGKESESDGEDGDQPEIPLTPDETPPPELADEYPQEGKGPREPIEGEPGLETEVDREGEEGGGVEYEDDAVDHYQSPEEWEPDVDHEAVYEDEEDRYEEAGPNADQEMPLTEHIREMVIRAGIVLVVTGGVSLLTYPFTEEIINFLWNSILPAGETTRPRLYGVLELLFTKLKVASLAGLIVALPVAIYETYQFMRPGLYPHERRYYLAAVPTSLVLALVGVSFAYFIILPAIFVYFLHYSQSVATIGFALGRTFDLILVLMGYLAIVFQIPLFIMLAMMMGLVTRRWLAKRRLIFWAAFLGISLLLFGPTDPTGASPFLVTITMILLFEGTLLLAKWTKQGRRMAAG